MNKHCFGQTMGARDGLTVIDCKACGFAHLKEFPHSDDSETFYRNEFWQKEKVGARATLEAQKEWWSAIHSDWLTIANLFFDIPNGSQLLDVGCGYGYFLREACSRGLVPNGIELNAVAATTMNLWLMDNNAKGWVTNAAWDKVSLGTFYYLSAFWLLEHLPDPLAFLWWCYDRLNDNGVLMLAVPNELTMAQYLTKGKVQIEDYWVHHTHYSYFTQKSLANLLGRAGFQVVDWSATYPVERFLHDGKDYTAKPELGIELHKEVESFDLSMSRIDRIEHYRRLASFGEGRDIVCFAVKA